MVSKQQSSSSSSSSCASFTAASSSKKKISKTNGDHHDRSAPNERTTLIVSTSPIIKSQVPRRFLIGLTCLFFLAMCLIVVWLDPRNHNHHRPVKNVINHHKVSSSSSSAAATPSINVAYIGSTLYDISQLVHVLSRAPNQGTLPCTVSQLLFGTDAYHVDEKRHAVRSNNASFLKIDRLERHSKPQSRPQWDFIVMNDNFHETEHTLATNHATSNSLRTLKNVYLPWFRQTHAIPVFLDSPSYTNGSMDVPTLTRLSYHSYKRYASMLRRRLPKAQRPRIAPSGLAFLTVWEEDVDLWYKLFSPKQSSASPQGSYLEALVLYATLFGKLPDKSVALMDDMSQLWSWPRLLHQTGEEPPSEFPTRRQAEYLYQVADRITRLNHRPSAYYETSIADGDEVFGFIAV